MMWIRRFRIQPAVEAGAALEGAQAIRSRCAWICRRSARCSSLGRRAPSETRPGGPAASLGRRLEQRGVNFAPVLEPRHAASRLPLRSPRAAPSRALRSAGPHRRCLARSAVAAACAAPARHYAFHVHGPPMPHKGQRFDPTAADRSLRARALQWRRRCDRCVVDRRLRLGRRPAAGDALARHVDLRAARQGLHAAASGGAAGVARQVPGLTVPAVIEHLKSLGVTAVELLPCRPSVSEQFLRERGLEQLLGLQLRRLVCARRTSTPCRIRWPNSRAW